MRHFHCLLILLVTACGAPTSTDNQPSRSDAGSTTNTDAGAAPSPDAGIPNPAVCGNGQVEEGEACDDGNLQAGDGCDEECAIEEQQIEDDHGNSPAEASQLPIGAAQRGVFEQADDIDVFVMNIALGGSYTVSVEGSGTLSCKITDANEETLAQDTAEGTCENIAFFEEGTYYLSLSLDAGDTPSRYLVQLQSGGVGPEPGTCGDGNRDFGEGCDDGNLESGDGCDANCQPELGDDVQGDSRDQAAALELDQEIASAINVGGDVDYYTFNTQAEGEYQINTTGDTDTYCHLEDENGQELATNDDGGEGLNCELIEELQANTRYFVKVRGFSETRVGAYAITVRYLTPPVCGNGQVERNEACDDGNLDDGDGCDSSCAIEDDFGNDIDGAESIDDPSTTEANLLVEDEDFFRFTAAATGIRQIHTQGTIDTYCYLLDAQGNELASSDDDGDGVNCQIQHNLTQGAVYVIRVRGFSMRVTGDYVLHLGPVAEAP